LREKRKRKNIRDIELQREGKEQAQEREQQEHANTQVERAVMQQDRDDEKRKEEKIPTFTV